eukprot:TRINITY_DN3849_c0_g1_i2.p2 TRINITY_DN3849_c0_g1~~TRINITY_DN3849_c0_g1_i2.p2  ORF type:complete len:126 (-),score=9.99 TRINITY_DN3849_c0_g1_i2:126-503(-)
MFFCELLTRANGLTDPFLTLKCSNKTSSSANLTFPPEAVNPGTFDRVFISTFVSVLYETRYRSPFLLSFKNMFLTRHNLEGDVWYLSQNVCRKPGPSCPSYIIEHKHLSMNKITPHHLETSCALH